VVVGSAVLSMIHEALALSLWRGLLCVTAETYYGPQRSRSDGNSARSRVKSAVSHAIQNLIRRETAAIVTIWRCQTLSFSSESDAFD
jgi:hypothetical protein